LFQIKAVSGISWFSPDIIFFMRGLLVFFGGGLV
jgi:hypothetical protein